MNYWYLVVIDKLSFQWKCFLFIVNDVVICKIMKIRNYLCWKFCFEVHMKRKVPINKKSVITFQTSWCRYHYLPSNLHLYWANLKNSKCWRQPRLCFTCYHLKKELKQKSKLFFTISYVSPAVSWPEITAVGTFS